MIGWLLLIWTFGILVVASMSDIRTREVADEISIIFIAGALALRLVGAFTVSSSFFLHAVIAGIFFGLVGLVFYVFKQWGGADFLLITGLGFAFGTLPAEFPNQISPLYPFAITLLINLLFIGAVYGIIWIIWLILKTPNLFAKFLKTNAIFLAVSAFLFLISRWFTPVIFLATAVLLWMALQAAKIVENSVFVRKIRLSQLREEDWLVDDIKIRGKILISANSPGVTKADLEAVKPFLNQGILVKIKEGVPFVPVFPLALAFTLLFGDFLLLIFKYLSFF